MITLRTSPNALIFAFLSERTQAMAPAMQAAYRMTPGEILSHPAHLESLLVSGHQAGGTRASAAEIGEAYWTNAAEVRARLVMLESMRFVSGRADKAEGKPRRVFVITGEGKRKVGISDARASNAQTSSRDNAMT